MHFTLFGFLVQKFGFGAQIIRSGTLLSRIFQINAGAIFNYVPLVKSRQSRFFFVKTLYIFWNPWNLKHVYRYYCKFWKIRHDNGPMGRIDILYVYVYQIYITCVTCVKYIHISTLNDFKFRLFTLSNPKRALYHDQQGKLISWYVIN